MYIECIRARSSAVLVAEVFPLINSSLKSYTPWTKPTSSNQYPMEKKNGNYHSKPDCCILFNIKPELRETDSSKWMLNAKFSQIKLFRGTYDNYHGTEIIWWSILFLKYLEVSYKSYNKKYCGGNIVIHGNLFPYHNRSTMINPPPPPPPPTKKTNN